MLVKNVLSLLLIAMVAAAFAGTGSIVLAETPATRLTPVIQPINTSILKDTTGSTTGTTAADTTKPVITKPVVIDKALINRIENNKDISRDEPAKKTDWAIFVQNMFSEYWVQLVALVVSIVGIFLAISGFSLANKKKQRHLKKFLQEIDDAYASYKLRSKRLEAEMIRLQDQIEDKLKEGALDEGTFHLLENRIHKYLEEIKTENGGRSAL